MDEKQEYTIEKERFLRRVGYEVIAVYECDVKEDMTAHPDMQDFIDTVSRNATTLNPRDALHGGRTNALRKCYRPKPGEWILYFDINVSHYFQSSNKHNKISVTVSSHQLINSWRTMAYRPPPSALAQLS